MVEIDKELFLDVPDIFLQDIRDKDGIQGLLIGEQQALSPVNPYQVGMPVSETLGVGFINRSLKGRISKFLEEFGGVVEECHDYLNLPSAFFLTALTAFFESQPIALVFLTSKTGT
jgi:hypothetical protein